ncbi:MAG: NYN domain-containing protein [Thermoplasmata archaeon]|nr:NYN domain-containing protein [Candidatus Sysuiplasma jiujiangense]
MDKTIVFIDDGYLSKISKFLGGGTYLQIDINQFAINLAKAQNLWCEEVYLYTAPPFQSAVPTTEEAEKRARYDRFTSRVRRISGFNVREGRLQYVDGEYRQKGVDTLLTMDLLTLTKENYPNIKTVILLACDTDFVPVLQEIRQNGVKIILYYFTDYKRGSLFSMSNYILTACDQCVLLDISYFTMSLRKQRSISKTEV